MDRTIRVIGLAALLAFSTPAFADPVQAALYKHPQCGCCETYATYLRLNDFNVDVKPTDDLAEISRRAGVPAEMEGCHTMLIDGNVIDGRVPVNIIRKLFSEKPAVAGMTLPGMPEGSPGIMGAQTGKLTISGGGKDGSAPFVYATE